MNTDRQAAVVCLYCGEALTRADVVSQRQHRACAARGVIGGLNHLLGRCSCCGGDQPPDPPELTRHQAARAALAYWEILTVAQREAIVVRQVQHLGVRAIP